jgi:hypothetical protein
MGRRTKIAIAVAALAVAAFIAWRIRYALLSEEARIRAAIGRTAAGFNAEEAGTVVSILADDYRDAETGLERNEIRLVLFQIFRTERDKEGRFRWAVEVPEDGTEVSVHRAEGKPPEADVKVRARFLERRSRGGEPSPCGTFLFTGHMTDVDGEWRIVRAGRELIEGRWPF